jgi:hypothetical protein
MRIFIAMIFILAICAAFELKMVPKKTIPCKEKMCYETYLEKMKGFINRTM